MLINIIFMFLNIDGYSKLITLVNGDWSHSLISYVIIKHLPTVIINMINCVTVFKIFLFSLTINNQNQSSDNFFLLLHSHSLFWLAFQCEGLQVIDAIFTKIIFYHGIKLVSGIKNIQLCSVYQREARGRRMCIYWIE